MAESGGKRIHGTTWDVYLCVLTSKEPKGVRDIWRELELSSPSLAQYHVNKLLELKLIEATPEGKYLANEDEQVEALRSFLRLRGRLIPRLVVYGALLSGILASYLYLWPFRWDFRDLVTLTVCIFSVLAFFFEAYRQYRGLNLFRA
ncbi:MAG: hypothetical protein ACE5OO_00090 [Candidatus Bathyarchaeia archaeon]